MANPRALNLLSLARKGGNISLGEENVGSMCRSGHARLILVASDASENAFHRAKSFTSSKKMAFIRVPYTKDELGAAMGRGVCAMAAITDVSLALAFVKALEQPEKYDSLLLDLDKRVVRVKQRRQEEKAHQKNVKNGKK